MKYLQYYNDIKDIFFYDWCDMRGSKNISYNMVVNDKEKFESLKQKSKQVNKNGETPDRILATFRIYFNRSSFFRPCVASLVYSYYKPKRILDPYAGYGSRMLGTIDNDFIEDYTGIDINTNLKRGYETLYDKFPKLKENCHIVFSNNEDLDFSAYKYDFVFSSPPFGIKEKWLNFPYNTSQEFKTGFQKVIKNVFNHLNPGGVMVLNIPKTYIRLINKWINIDGKRTHDFIKNPPVSYIFYEWKKPFNQDRD